MGPTVIVPLPEIGPAMVMPAPVGTLIWSVLLVSTVIEFEIVGELKLRRLEMVLELPVAPLPPTSMMPVPLILPPLICTVPPSRSTFPFQTIPLKEGLNVTPEARFKVGLLVMMMVPPPIWRFTPPAEVTLPLAALIWAPTFAVRLIVPVPLGLRVKLLKVVLAPMLPPEVVPVADIALLSWTETPLEASIEPPELFPTEIRFAI